MAVALIRQHCKPRASSVSNNGIQYTPVDSIATVRMPYCWSQSAMAYKSTV
jgi:hypothetical protein